MLPNSVAEQSNCCKTNIKSWKFGDFFANTLFLIKLCFEIHRIPSKTHFLKVTIRATKKDSDRPITVHLFFFFFFGSGSKSIVNFENVGGGDSTERSFFQRIDQEENNDDDYDACFHQPGKKRRLTVDQVQFLERNFELENKLEPERKVQLAKELGLQPRQVAIWFQNRRARFKTKQLEKEYDSLKASCNKLKADYDSLLKENENLKNEVNFCLVFLHTLFGHKVVTQ